MSSRDNRSFDKPSDKQSTPDRNFDKKYLPLKPQRSGSQHHDTRSSKDQQQNFKRTNKISSLQHEFQELKKKIREVENKNEKIIEKIQHNKGQRRLDDSQDVSDSSLEYMRNSDQIYRTSNFPPHPSQSYKGKDNVSEGMFKRSSQRESRQHRDLKESREPRDSRSRDRQVEIPLIPQNSSPTQIPLSPHQRRDSVDRLSRQCNRSTYTPARTTIDIEKSSRQTKQFEQRLRKQEYKFQCLQSNFKNFKECTKLIFHNQLQKFMESVVVQKMLEMQKKTRRIRDRLDRMEIKKPRSVFSSLPSISSSSKFKELQNLVSKYQQLIKSKNDELETIQNKLKTKEKQIQEQKITIDKLKDNKRKLENESDENKIKLETKISNLNEQIRKLTVELDRAVKTAKATSSASTDVVKKSNLTDWADEVQKLTQQFNEVNSKLSLAQKTLNQKNRLVVSLQKQLLQNKQKKQELLRQYQQNIDQNRHVFKQKLEEHLKAHDQLKIQLIRKEEMITTMENQNRTMQQKETEAKIELNNLQQRLDLKEKMEKMKEQQHKQAVRQLQEKMAGMQHEDQTKENKKLQLEVGRLKVEIERKEREREQEVKLRGKCEEEIGKMREKMREMEKKSQEKAKEETKKVQTVSEAVNSSFRDISQNTSHIQTESPINIQNTQQLGQLRQQNEQIRQQSLQLQKSVINLENQLKICENLKSQLNQKVIESKNRLKQLEHQKSQKQKQIQNLKKSIETIKSKHNQEILNLDHDLKVVQDGYNLNHQQLQKETEKVNQKSQQIKRLHEQLLNARKGTAESELLRMDNQRLKIQNEKYRLKLSDLQEQLKQHSTTNTRIQEQYRQNILQVNGKLEKSQQERVKFEQQCKFLQNKVQQMELDMFQQEAASQSQSVDDKLKNRMKILQKNMIQQEINKANIERRLKMTEDMYNTLTKEHKEQTMELQKNKADFYKIILSYDEKIHEQEEIIKQMKEEKEPQKKSELKSQSSLMFSMNSQVFNEKQIDFNLSEVSADYAEPNVENIFEKGDIAFDRLKLRRKDQVQLLQRTAKYINALKKTINQKNRKIKGLQKRLESSNRDLPFKLDDNFQDYEQKLSDFNDNYSVKFENRRGDNRRKLRQLENQTHLVMQQNNLLLQKVQSLQEQLQHAQEQQNGLIRMKEIYKDQISKLRKALEEKDVTYNQEILKLQKKLEQSSMNINFDTVRQLLSKIFGFLFNQEQIMINGRRKEEKRKEFEECFKVLSSIFKIDNPIKEKAWIWRK